MQAPPGAPGTARQGPTRTTMLVTSGGKATQPRAPGHGRPPAAQRAAGHGRLSADSGAPGADVPLAMTAGAPGQHCLSAALRAPGHERPPAAPRAVDYHWSCARYPQVPGQGRFPTAPRAAGHDRLSAALLMAPGPDVPLATTARAPGQDHLRAMPSATAPSPAGLRRLRQGCLPRVPANPRTPIYPHSRSTASSLRRKPQSRPRPAAGRRADSPSLPGKGPGDRSKLHHTWHYPCGFGLSGGRSKPLPANPTTHQVHPAIQVPPDPRSCSTACTGFSLQHPSRAPPHVGPPKTYRCQPIPPSPHGGEGAG